MGTLKCIGNIFNAGLTAPRFPCTCPNCESARALKGYSIRPDPIELYGVFLVYVAALHGQKLPRNMLITQKKFWASDLKYIREWLAKYDMNL